jgi:phosphotransferase family enzyme
VSDAIMSSLQELVGELLGSPTIAVEVRRSRYSTSFPIDDLFVATTEGVTRRLVRKDLAWDSLLPEARSGKPPFLYDPYREVGVYRSLLADAPTGTARCFGTGDDGAGWPRWLFLERVDGVELYQVGDLDKWVATAEWAARLHLAFAGRVDELRRSSVPLHVHDRAWIDRWADRMATAAVTARAPVFAATCRVLRAVPALRDRLASMPMTLVHGELYASNVIVGREPHDRRVCPIDWEMAALAPGLVDLAALTAGDWSESDRTAMEEAYCRTVGRTYDSSFVADLDACRLASCIQWLGWAPGWAPPEEHAYGWLAEAVTIVERLGLA